MIPELRTEHLWRRPSSTITLFHCASLLIHIRIHMLHVHVLQSQHVLLPFLSSQPHRNGAPCCPPPFPLHHLHLYFDAYVLFIHSSQIRSREIRDICCTHFEDASCCSITCRAKVLFAFSGIGSAWLTGGGRLHARHLINKIFYVNATEERGRWKCWCAGLFCIRIRKRLEEVDMRVLSMETR